MTSVNERLADYRERPATSVRDPRWEAIILDLRENRIWLEPMVQSQFKIVVRAAKQDACLRREG